MKPSLLLPCLSAAFLIGRNGIASAQNEALPVTVRSHAQTREASVAIATAKKATVLIDTLDGTGTGFCIDEAGVFVTNAHVVAGKIRARVVINSGEANQKVFIARVTHRDDANDLAVVAIDPEYNKGQVIPPLTALPLGDSNDLFETLPVTVLGFPYGTDLALDAREMPSVTITTGKVTALRKRQGVLKEVQLDAATNPGNSGGPVIDSDGKVVGIMYAIIDGAQGLNFAIPVATLRGLLTMPEIRFDPPEVPFEDQQKDFSWTVQIVPFAKFATPNAAGGFGYDLSFSLTNGGIWRDATVTRTSVEAAPVAEFRVSGRLFGNAEAPKLVPRFRLIVRQHGKTILTQQGNILVAAGPDGRPVPASPFGGGRNNQPPVVAPVLNPANGHWYQCVKGDFNGEEAKVAAESMTHAGFKGHLVSINSAAEEAFITPLLADMQGYNASAWTGGSQKPGSAEPAGGWEWDTGEPMRYTNWAAGEPNNAGNENNLQLRRDGGWNDGNARERGAGFVVEFESPEGIAKASVITDAPQVEGDKTMISLPSPATDVVAGGGGRFLLFHLKTEQKIAVFDAEAKKIVRYIPVPGDKVLMTAGQDKLVLLLADQNILQRYNLQTGVREQSLPLSDDQAVKSIALGSASNGPLFVVREREVFFLDLSTLQKLEITDTVTNQPLSVSFKGPANAAPDGSAFSISSDGGSRQSRVLALDGNHVTQYPIGANIQGATPSFDGHWWFSSAGIFNNEGKPVIADQLRDGNAFQMMIPAYAPSYFIAVKSGNGPAALTVYSANDRRALATLTTDEIGSPRANNGGPFGFGGRPNRGEQAALPLEKRVHYLPDRKLLLTVSNGYDQLVLRQFDLKTAMSQNGEKYFFVASNPPRQVPKGATLNYQIDLQSQAKGVKYNLESGPAGMAVSPTGLLTWNVPADFATGEVTVLLAISNEAGQELYHTFKVGVR